MAVAAGRSLLRKNTKQRKREAMSSRILPLDNIITNRPSHKSKSVVLFNPNTVYNPKKVIHRSNEARITYSEFPCNKVFKTSINNLSFHLFVYFNKLNVVNPFVWNVNYLENEAFDIARFALSEISSDKQGTSLWLERILRYQIMNYEGKNHLMTMEVYDNCGKHMMYQVVVHEESAKDEIYTMELYCWTYVCDLPVIDPSGDASISEFSVLYMSVMCMAYICFGCVKYTYDWIFKLV